MRAPSNAARGVVILLLLLHAADAMRLGWADHLLRRETLLDVFSAAGLDPLNARIALAAGRLEEDAGNNPQPHFRRAIILNPRDANAWIRSGLAAEQAGNFAEAERCLLMAAGYSAQNEPRWALANFYFRRNVKDRFWQWASEAARTWYRDPAPLFDLAWAISPDASQIRERLIDTAPMLASFARYLARAGQLQAAFEAAIDSRDPKLAPLVDDLLGANRIRQAHQLARALQAEAAFAWRIVEQHGARWEDPNLILDGKQSENADLLIRTFPVPTAPRVRLTWQASGLNPEGFRVRVLAAAKESRILGEEHLARSAAQLTIPQGVEGVHAVIAYTRPPGKIRAAGTLRIHSMTLEAAVP